MVQTCTCPVLTGGQVSRSAACVVHGHLPTLHITFTNHRNHSAYYIPNDQLYRLLPAWEPTVFRIPGES